MLNHFPIANTDSKERRAEETIWTNIPCLLLWCCGLKSQWDELGGSMSTVSISFACLNLDGRLKAER